MKSTLFAVLLFLVSFATCFGQTYHTPTLEGVNNFTNVNTFIPGDLQLTSPIAPCSTGQVVSGYTVTFAPICVNSVSGQIVATTSIQAAVNAAASTCSSSASTCGSVLVPSGYTGSSDLSSNTSGILIFDLRPLNQGGSFTNQATQIVNAAMFGAKCNGGSDDSAAIQAALNSLWVYNLPLATKEQMTVELPQGSCLIMAPIELGAYASLVGQGASTFVVCDYFVGAWRGSDHNCLEMVANGTIGGGASIGQRIIGNFSLLGIGNGPGASPQGNIADSTGIAVINNANVYDPSGHTFHNISFQNIQMSGFDTGMNAQDLDDSEIVFSKFSTMRVGLNFNGDAVGIRVNNTLIFDGSWAATTTDTQTYGVMVQTNSKYSNGSNVCGVNLYCSPQGISLHQTDILSFDTDYYQGQCVSCTIQNGALDQAGEGPVGSGYAIQLDVSAVSDGLLIADNQIGQGNGADPVIYSTDVNAAGLTISRNYFFLDAGVTDAGADGIVFAGTGHMSAKINDNFFSGLTTGISAQQALTYSSISGNSGSSMATNLIDLSGISSLVHTATVVQDNVDSDSKPVVNFGTATGFHLGWNQSPSQLTGTTVVAQAGCTISAGSIGATCNNTITFSTAGGIAQTNTTYRAICTASGGTGLWTVGNANTPTNTTVIVPSVALSTSATGGGFINCSITSVQ